jgi:DNA-binding MarR family transcriptional regulator
LLSLSVFKNETTDAALPRPCVSCHDIFPDVDLRQSDFERLLQLRTGLRRFLRWSEQQAEAAGVTPAQHQLLLAVKGHPDPAGPTIGEVAEYLVVRHHSAGELIARAEAAGLVVRTPDAVNGTVVRVALTSAGISKLDELAVAHLEELAHLGPTMRTLWKALEQSSDNEQHPAARPRHGASG